MLKLARKVLCLDWDKRSLRLVVARVGGGRMKLEDAHAHHLPHAVDADDPAALGEFIRQQLRRHHLRQRHVVIDVPRERAVINRLTLPPTPDAEVAAAVRFQAMKELPFPVDSAAVDYVIVGREERGLAVEVLLAAVTLETLERIKATCAAAGLMPERIGLRPYANVVSVEQVLGATDEHVLFVDVGPGATEIDVIRGRQLAFARSANVNVPVPKPLETDGHEGSRIISISEIADLMAGDAGAEAAVDELLVEVTRTLQAFRATDAEAVVGRVVVAGGTGIETALAERLEQRLGYPAVIYDPTGPLGVAPSDGPKLRSFSAVLGLAWGLSREGLLALDFLNPKRPVSGRAVLQRRLRLAGLAAAAVAVLGAGLWFREYNALRRQHQQMLTANNKLWDGVLAKAKIRNRVDEVQEWTAQALWPDELLHLTQLAVEPGQKMVVQEIQLDAVAKTPLVQLRNVSVADWRIPTQYVERLKDFEWNGTRPYDARQGTWNGNPDGQRFKGTVDIQVTLRRLKEFRDAQPQREKERRERLQEPQ